MEIKCTGWYISIFLPSPPRAAPTIESAPIQSVDPFLTGTLREAYFPAAISLAKWCSMTPYLRLSEREWQTIVPHLPRQKSGPRRRHDRETVTAFLFAAASHVTFDCLPDCGFPNPLTLRTTWQRWRASGELAAVMAAGQRRRREWRGKSAADHRPVAAAAAAEGDRQAFGDDAALGACEGRVKTLTARQPLGEISAASSDGKIGVNSTPVFLGRPPPDRIRQQRRPIFLRRHAAQ